MNEKKKIPVLKYLSYLLIVAVLFTGVTFSRYSSATSGDVIAGVSPFVAEYEIDDISATSYTNSDFFLQSGTATGTPRTVRMTVRNYERGESGGVSRYSDIDLQAAFRLYLPAELADHLVLQFAEARGDEMQTISPQYVIGDLVYAVSEGGEDTDGDGVNEYVRQTGSDGGEVYADYTGGGVRETAKSRDYQERECKAETLSMTGGFAQDGAGYIEARADSGNVLSVTSAYKMFRYSVGFHRGVDQNDYRSQLYLDLEKEVLFYTIDVTLPQMRLQGMNAQEKTFVLYLSLANRIDGADFNYEWTQNATDEDTTADMGLFLVPPSAGEELRFNGANVLGYHFDVTAKTYETLPSQEASGTTTVRVQKTFDYAGGAENTYYHVAPVSESTYAYVHPIADFYDAQGGSIAVTGEGEAAEMQAVYGVCENLFGSQSAYYISFDGVNDHPLYEDFAAQEAGGEGQYSLFSSLSKSYSAQFNVLFVQSGESVQGGTKL